MSIGGVQAESGEYFDLENRKSYSTIPFNQDQKCLNFTDGIGGFIENIPTICGGSCNGEDLKSCSQLINNEFGIHEFEISSKFMMTEKAVKASFTQDQNGIIFHNNDYVSMVIHGYLK